MGGKAFLQLLPQATFPRMPPGVYETLKHAAMARLQQLYGTVVVPTEAPGKVDYGDLDYLVAEPRAAPSHDDVNAALGAAACIPMEGNRTSNYAIPFSVYGAILNLPEEDRYPAAAYFQVDVHPCDDMRELEAINFFNSYGDMGMILGVIARGVGLHLGAKGLRTEGQPLEDGQPPSFVLSSDVTDILAFFGLSLDRWRQGFGTREDAYDWLLSARFLDPLRLHDPPRGAAGRRERTMYHGFFEYAHARLASSAVPPAPVMADRDAAKKEARKRALEEALVYFGRAEEFSASTARNRRERARREVFTSAMVRAWTGLATTDWRVMKRLMDAVRSELGGEDAMLDLEEREIKDAVLRLRPSVEHEVEEEWERVCKAREVESGKTAAELAT